MGKKQSAGVQRGIPAPAGTKITFGEDNDFGADVEFAGSDEAGPSSRKGKSRRTGEGSIGSSQANDDDEDEHEDEQSDDDDDDEAPETVGISARDDISREADYLAEQSRKRREAAQVRSRKIAEMKAKSANVKSSKTQPKGRDAVVQKGKGKRKAEPESESEEDAGAGEDADTKRLKRRMQMAMAQGDDEDTDDEDEEDDEGDEDDEDEDELDDEGDSELEGSFHTDSEDGSEEEGDEDDDESDDSERLEEGPISEETRRLRERMQAVMEAAEARARKAGSSAKTEAQPKSALNSKTKTKERNQTAASESGDSGDEDAKAEAESDSEAGYDLAPLNIVGKPLSSAALARAEEAEREKALRQEEKAARMRLEERHTGKKAKRDKKRRKVEEVTRPLGSNKSIHLLAPSHTPSISVGGLPPPIAPGTKAQSISRSQDRFYRLAMKNSGIKPGMIPTEGRIKVGRR